MSIGETYRDGVGSHARVRLYPALTMRRIRDLLMTGSALGITIAMQRQDGDVLWLVPSIVLAAWLFEWWGGLLATFLACAGAYASAITTQTSSTALLALSGVAISALSASLRRAGAGSASDHEEAVSRLRTSESTLARAQRIAHVGSWELDIASGQLEWSDEIFRLFGMTPGSESVTYEHFMAHVHPDDRDRLQHAQDLALRGEAPLNIEHRIVRADEQIRWVQEVAELQADAPGHAQRLIGTVLDVTARTQAQLQLQEAKESLEQTVSDRTAQLQAALVRAKAADEAKSSFLATMSHELRTPLNSIIGFTGILLQSLAGPLNPEQSKQLGMVQGSARHLLELINDVLDLSKIEAQQMQVQSEPFDLAALVERVVASVGPQATRKGLTLAIELPDRPIEMVGDRRRVEQVLINLLGNGTKFTERGGVTLTVDELAGPGSSADTVTARVVRMRVSDTGIGMRPNDLDKLFRPFHQVDTGLTRTHEGTGLGLAICSRLVGLMGGNLTVDSQLGVGSTFTVTLPESGVASR
ncbi:MAG: PAS domain-containing protein [Nocardioides sp.]|nr:PAS domain-containing protein [Nocardioides sp.]